MFCGIDDEIVVTVQTKEKVLGENRRVLVVPVFRPSGHARSTKCPKLSLQSNLPRHLIRSSTARHHVLHSFKNFEININTLSILILKWNTTHLPLNKL
jgi:hypothetical protein